VPRTIAHLNIQFIVSGGIEKAAATAVQPVVEPGKSRQPEIRDCRHKTLNVPKYSNLLPISNQVKE
jgi:hypothetical protein